MNFKQLNEVLSLYTDGRFKYADIDAQAVYDNCVNADFGSHTFEEADKFKEFVGITKDTTEEELRAIRNTLVKFWADYVKEYKGDDHGRSRSKEESDKEWKMGDQMQFYTHVIDMAINNLPEDKRIKQVEEFIPEVNETLITFEDRCNWINEDGKEAQLAIENIMNKFDYLGKNYDDEKQGIICDRICEILEQCSTNLNDIAKRMK